jgi:FMN phosphatase YigB (HAD superfamily)
VVGEGLEHEVQGNQMTPGFFDGVGNDETSEAVFRHAAEWLNRHPDAVVSIGDQNHSDILPAKRVGMRTIIVGPNKADADFRVEDVTSAIRLVREWEQ